MNVQDLCFVKSKKHVYGIMCVRMCLPMCVLGEDFDNSKMYQNKLKKFAK